MGRPSTAITWVSGSAEAPSSATTPSTVTRPAVMRSSLARREAKPASARAFCRRIFIRACLSVLLGDGQEAQTAAQLVLLLLGQGKAFEGR